MSDRFSADLAGLQDLARTVHDRADDTRAVRNGLQQLPSAEEQNLGNGGAFEAYQAFFSAWSDELMIISNGLDELEQKLNAAAAHYHEFDVHWSQHFQAIDWPSMSGFGPQ